ncbi:PIG-L family deacetylase [Nostocoides sp. Soil756]|uniref:PIG-L family deacetylase n=1 Tax=Nostocoides sp. Soil756 TaxID=1736399 RepID=UPI0006FCC39F|nr:PIG-L family deacetylase [Tetrasphaera sp. Soil756]KRE61134.1 GlcNAc-PI de-N-acetylase [Tetrasphaera sp. Soil756]
MSTIVFLHAHPDDEASQTSGTMARAVDEGHRVVLVVSTGGEHGTVPDDLAPGETLVDRRRRELETSARAIGLHRVEWLGYADSGMTGWEQNGAAGAFTAADLDEAAARFAAVLDEEDADVAVGYDWHGGYGHPDHVKVHHVLHRAAERAARRPRVLESTMNRDAMREMARQGAAAGRPDDWDPDRPMDDGNPMGTPQDEIHWQVDVRALIERKRAALAAHASQTSDVGMMLAMPPEVFTAVFGYEHFIEPGRPSGMVRGWPFAPR